MIGLLCNRLVGENFVFQLYWGQWSEVDNMQKEQTGLMILHLPTENLPQSVGWQ